MADMRKETLVKAIQTLNIMLNVNKEFLEILIIGGANMCLFQGNRSLTHDIDTYTKQVQLLEKYKRLVGTVLNLDRTWINSVGEMFVTQQIIADSSLVYNFSNLKVFTPSDKAMLALKVAAGRTSEFRNDLKDAAFLIQKLNLVNNMFEIKRIVDYYKPGYWGKFGAEEKFCREAFKLI